MNEVTHNAAVAGNNLVSFSGVSMEHRADIFDVLMYAEFFATQARRRNSDWNSWMNYYKSQLLNSGCQLKSHIIKEPMVINNANELDNIGFGVTGSVRVTGLMELARRSFRAARLSEHAEHFFRYGTDSGYFNHFQVVPCESVGTDDVSILICGVHASATASSESRGGDWRVNREMVVRLAGGVYHFNGQAYLPHRERIRSRLRDVSGFNIKQLSI